FYVSIFKNAKILSVDRMPEGTPGPTGKVLSGSFQIEGQEFMVLNGGPQFPFTEAISLFVNCETQAEVDDLWEKLPAGGSKDRCEKAVSQEHHGLHEIQNIIDAEDSDRGRLEARPLERGEVLGTWLDERGQSREHPEDRLPIAAAHSEV